MAYPQPDDDLTSYPGHLREYYCALRERVAFAFGCVRWPRGQFVWAGGVAGAVADLGDGHLRMTDATVPLNAWPMPSGGSGASRWVGYSHPVSCYVPRDYDVVFEVGGRADESRVVRGQITANTAGGSGVAPTVTFTDGEIRDAITGGFIASVADLVGKEYVIIKRDGQWWAGLVDSRSRWPAFPNDRELWIDVAVFGSEKFLRAPFNRAAGPTFRQAWSPDQWAGREVLAVGGGRLRRLTVVWNSEDTLYFVPRTDPPPAADWIDPAPTYSLTGIFSIVPVGAKGDPRRWAMKPFWGYGGAKRGVVTKLPDDSIGVIDVPATIVQWEEGAPCNNVTPSPCELKNHPAMDLDLWSYEFEECGAPEASDRNYSPDHFKTPRGCQQEVVAICTAYLDHTRVNPGALSNFTPARLFRAADINWGNSTVTEDAPHVFSAAVDPIYNGYTIWWEVLNADDTHRMDGRAVAAAGRVPLPATLWDAADVAIDPTHRTLDVGKRVIYSAGFTREHPLTVRRPYPKGPILVPDVVIDPDTGEFRVLSSGVVENFAESGCDGAGRYVRFPRSTAYSIVDDFEVTAEGGTVLELGRAVRLEGDSWDDPGVVTLGDGLIEPGTADAEVTDYWVRFNQSTHVPSKEGLKRGQYEGVATAGDDFSLTDDTRDFYSTWYGSAGVVRLDTGTATAGTISTLTDNAKRQDTLSEAACYWDPARWIPENKPFKYEQLLVTSGANAGLRRPISDADAATGTLTVSPAFPHPIAAGDGYAVEVLHEANNLEGRTLRVYDLPPGTGYKDLWITGNSRRTIFYPVTAEYTTAAGQRWEVLEPHPGGVWVVAAAPPADPEVEYVQLAPDRFLVRPTGADPRKAGVDWHRDNAEDLPHLAVKRYGWFHRGDYVTLNLRRELWRAINALRGIVKSVTWSGRANPAVAEDNWRAAGHSSSAGDMTDAYDDPDGSWAFMFDEMNTGWAAGGNTQELSGSLPWATSGGRLLPTASFGSYSRHYAYAQVTGLPTCVDSNVEIWVYAIAPNDSAIDLPVCGDCECARYDPGSGFYCMNCRDPSPPYNAADPDNGCYATRVSDAAAPGCYNCRGAGGSAVFDNNGDGPFGRRQWGSIDSVLVSGGATDTRKYKVGNTDAKPAAPGQPGRFVTGQYNDSARGYQVQEGAAVAFGVFACCAGEVPPDDPPPSGEMGMDVVEWFEA